MIFMKVFCRMRWMRKCLIIQLFISLVAFEKSLEQIFNPIFGAQL